MGGWSDERVVILTRLWGDGLSAGKISKQMGGFSRNAVIGKVHRLGLPAHSDTVRKLNHESGNRTLNARIKAGSLAPKLKPDPRPIRVIEIMEGCATRFADLRHYHCRWPVEMAVHVPMTEDSLFCGAPKVTGCPYCVGHMRLAYVPAKKKAARDLLRSVRKFAA